MIYLQREKKEKEKGTPLSTALQQVRHLYQWFGIDLARVQDLGQSLRINGEKKLREKNWRLSTCD